MEWTKFKESTREYPEKAVEKLISGFSTATNELVTLTLQSYGPFERLGSQLNSDFQFSIYLRSQFVPKYKLEVFTFGYNVELAPITFIIEESIFEEVFKRAMRFEEKIVAKDIETLNQMLSEIFATERFKEIVGGLMKIAQKNSTQIK